MAIDYSDLRKASSPNGLMDLLASLGHEPISDWDGLVDIRAVILEDNIPPSIRSSVADDAITIRELTSLVGEQKGIECYAAILRPGLKLSSSVCRNLSHAFRNVSSITRIDETFLFIGAPDEKNTELTKGELAISQWATIHLSRVYRKAGSSEELRLSRLDWTPTKMSRHTLDCLKSLQVDAFPGQVDDTEVERFKKEVKEWFNKERLSRRFFREFYKRFEFALDLVQRKARIENYAAFEPSKNKPITSYNKKDRESDLNRQHAGKYILKQILRLLFLHYLQEKEWLCKDKHFLINQWKHYEEKTHSIPNYDATTATGFHSEVLIPLFFETLNRCRPDNAPNNWGETQWDRDNYSKMPYLNGGIFDIDKINDHWDFVTKEPLFLIPDAVFSADRDYDPKLDDETLIGRQVNLLAFLDDYHFTIAEDTPVDEAVALDPELMGKIFENLLVSRHSDGAYYTPRSIVRFQCKDTLARYLEEQLADLGDLDHDWFLTLFDLDRDFSKLGPTWSEEKFSPIVADRIEAALKECKVLDPAVGSGAYLLGMLTEMLRLRQICHIVRTGHMVDRGSTEFYRWKSEIIRDSLYGVDINPEAVAICHLRLWLAMVVDQNRESTSPLPNLLFQITAGDSLRDSINGHKIFVTPGGEKIQSTLWSYSDINEGGEPNDEPIKKRLEKITQLREIHYDENLSPSLRAKTCEDIQNLRIEMMLEGLEQLEIYELKQVKNSNLNSIKKDEATNSILAKFNNSRRRVAEGSFTSIFSYEAIFGEVFQRKGRQGFDIIIGNPPYLEDEGAGGYNDIQKLLDLESNNLYAMFWIRSIRDLLRPEGQVSFITSDSFLTIRSHVQTRKSILTESKLHYAIQAGNWFFTFNNAWTAIVTVSKRKEGVSLDSASNIEDNMIAYDITKLPNGNISALEKALELWKPTFESRARTSDLFSNLTDEGNDSSWYLQLEGEGKALIGRYSYPLGLPLKNTNVPFFHACPKLFKLIWDNGNNAPNNQSDTFNFEDWVHTIDTTKIVLNDNTVILSKLGELAIIKQGIGTGDDNFYLRKLPEARGSMDIVDKNKILLTSELNQISNNEGLRKKILKEGISESLFEGRVFVPFVKPPVQRDNTLNMFWAPKHYYIDWSTDTVRQLWTYSQADVKRRRNPEFVGTHHQNKTRAAVWRSIHLYFQEFLHITFAGETSPQIWRPWGGVPSNKAAILYSETISWDSLLALTSSKIFTLLAKAYRGCLSMTQGEVLLSTPIPINYKYDGDEIEKICNLKIDGNPLYRSNKIWNDLSNDVSTYYQLSDNDADYVEMWTQRRFSRPGVIE